MKILFVGGDYNYEGGRKSSVVEKFAAEIQKDNRTSEFKLYNGGNYSELPALLQEVKNYDIAFWWTNVPNELSKTRNVKEINPNIILVTSKRNDNAKYSFAEIVNHALSLKANLTVEFSLATDKMFRFMAFDPLGTVWYDGADISECVKNMMNRLVFLKSMTRQRTIQLQDSPVVPDESKFFEIVKNYAEVFHEMIAPAKEVSRFLGNASFRCLRGFPSFRSGNYIYVSMRNVDKRFIDKEHFVATYLASGDIFYCGENKPSVDTPIQLRLYEKLKNINYIIHAHCYVEGGTFTSTPIPCGAIEEVDEILSAINGTDQTFYKINLIGHGCIIMSSNIDNFEDIKFIKRNLPEKL